MIAVAFQSTSETVIAVEFHPMDRDIIVTCGKGHICFWHVENGMLVKRLGIFEVYSVTYTFKTDCLIFDANSFSPLNFRNLINPNMFFALPLLIWEIY